MSVVISMPEGAQNVGQARTPKELATTSSERSSGEPLYAERPGSSERSVSHDRAQTSGAPTFTTGGKTVSS